MSKSSRPTRFLSASTDAPFDAHAVALDSQALREGAWPKPNARLAKLRELAGQFGPHFWVVEGAVAELRAAAERRLREAANNLLGAADQARKAGLTVSCGPSGIDQLMSVWNEHHTQALVVLNARVIPHTTRPASEFFPMAVARVAPFDDRGAGFRDAVILASVADELTHLGLSSALLVTADKDFDDAVSPVPTQSIRAITLDAAITNFERLAEARSTAALNTLLDKNAQREALATAAVHAAATSIEVEMVKTFEVSQADVPNLNGVLTRPISYRLVEVKRVAVSPWVADVDVGDSVDATAVLVIEGEFEIEPIRDQPMFRLRVGQSIEQLALLRALENEESAKPVRQIETATFTVASDLRLRRTADGYAFAEIVRFRSRPSGEKGA